jgi:YidC/Oxa1 family membrane protein insertase
VGRKTIILVVLIAAGFFLYEPVMERFFTDTSLQVNESDTSYGEDQEPVYLETRRLQVRFSPYGGRITSARLKDFEAADHQPVELVFPSLKTRGGIRVELPEVLEGLDDRLYRYDRDGGRVTFTQETPGGLAVRKSYRALGDYGILFELRIDNRGEGPIEFPSGSRIVPFYGIAVDDGEDKKTTVFWMNPAGNQVFREKAKKVESLTELEGPVPWVGIQNRYFVQALVKQDDKEEQVLLNPLGEWQVYAGIASEPFSLEPGGSRDVTYSLYLGPLIAEELQRHHPGLEKIVNYGTFQFLGKGVLLILRSIHRVVANYGVSLILLALVIRIILFPLTQYNLKSLREMPRIAKEIYDIEEQENGDPGHASARLHPLRKKRAQAMVGSFVPLAIQIPIFLALYQVLHSSLELRKAGFALWVDDLSLRDPYFLLPALMGCAMILQQRLTSVDPGDDKTWIWMPLGFALLFAFFPAGLVLFWLADTLFSVGQLSWIAMKEKRA